MKRLPLLACLAWAVTAYAQVPSHVPTDGLVAWYGLESDALDGSGNGNNLTTAGNPQWLTINGQGYADLDGNGDFFFNDDPSFPVLNEVFLSCWVRIDAFGSGGGSNLKPILSKWYTSGASYGNSFIIYESDNSIRWVSDYGSNPSPTFSYQHNWSTGEWHHIAAYYGDSLKLFIDGSCVSEGINVSDYDNSNSNFRIGDWYNTLNSGYSTLDGGIRAVGIWNRGLSAIEAQALFTEIPPIIGCTEEGACNYNETATIDDGSCNPSGCMDDAACNYNADAQCEGEACDYSCCPGPGCCGNGMHWDAAAQTCVITPPSVPPDAECTLLNLQELAEGYQILLDQVDSQQNQINVLEQEQAASNPCGAENTLTYAGHEYDIIDIGQQCWFAENLRTTTFNNGDPLLQNLNDAAWNSASGPACAVYGELDSPCQQELSTVQYCGDPMLSLQELGRLYNGHSVTDSRNICPSGWHVAADLDFLVLESFLGMSANEATSTDWRGTNQGTQLKGTSNWYENGNGSDLFGLNIKPSGYRASNGAGHRNAGGLAYFWTSTMGGGELYRRVFSHGQPGIQRLTDSLPLGFSIRCVKD